MVDTRKIDYKRHVLQLVDLRGKVILAPPDERLDHSEPERLTGPCFVLHYMSC